MRPDELAVGALVSSPREVNELGLAVRYVRRCGAHAFEVRPRRRAKFIGAEAMSSPSQRDQNI
jgi:hypothetical protein